MGLGCIYFMCMSLSPAGMPVYYVHAWRLWEQDEGQAYPLQAASVLTAEQCLHPKSSTVEVHPGLSLGVSLLLDLLPPYSAVAGALGRHHMANCFYPGHSESSELLRSAPRLAKARSQPCQRQLK